MAKIIAVFSDGTGNSSSQLFKTNVWRMYQALDTTGPVPRGGLPQIAYYDNGVGTSSFRPIAFLGGAFGWGLKRNVIDLYAFLCRVYEPGDHLYMFGFSRGAYTVRVLAGLVIREGLVSDTGRQELQMHARDAYRSFRHQFNPTHGLVNGIRGLRDGIINWWRRRSGRQTYAQRKADPRFGNRETGVAFIGVWDTVAAYGTPLAELTRAIDDWIWPLSMPNYRLSPRVSRGRHALALDDERDTFHPLLWDERHEEDRGRLKQVWFAGVHSDVGGGYPDDSLSYVSLDWMCAEAAAPDWRCGAPGLRFRAEELARIADLKDPCGPLHDSRRGLGAYYRYQPRKLSARMEPPDPTTLLMQDPDPETTARLRSVIVHESVFERIRRGTDRYAPVGLPGTYEVTSGSRSETKAESRARCQEIVWDWVWHKRVNYFLTVLVSIALGALPAWHAYSKPAACIGVQCVISPAIEAAGALLPAMAQPWIVAFARAPGTFVTLVLLLASLVARSHRLQTTIRDNMRALWKMSLRIPGNVPKVAPADPLVRTLRQNGSYQRGLQFFKWMILPNVLGVGMLYAAVALTLLMVAIGVIRAGIWIAEADNSICEVMSPAVPFQTSNPCWPVRERVETGKRYRIELDVDPRIPWRDRTIDASPRGLGAGEMSLVGNLFTPIRRSLSGRWFQPMVKIVPSTGRFKILALDLHRDAGGHYVAQFTASKSGALFMFVNDVLLPPWVPEYRRFYRNNQGTLSDARVTPVE